MLRFLATAIIFLVAGGAIGRFVLAPKPPPKQQIQVKPSDRVYLNWRLVSVWPTGLPVYGTLARRLATQLQTATGGAITFTLVEPGKDNLPGDCFKHLKAGENAVGAKVNACWSAPVLWAKQNRSLPLFGGAPFGPNAAELMAWITLGGGQELLDEIYQRHGLKSIVCGIAAADGGGWFRKQVTKVDDLKGLRMRIFGLGARVMEKLGVATRHMTGKQLVGALQSGQIDAAEYSMPAIDVGVGFHKLVSNYYFPGWHQPTQPLELLVSLRVWKSLPETVRSSIEAVCGDNFRYGLAESLAIQASALRELRARGVSIRPWPKEVLAALRKAWAEVVKEEIAVDPGFKKVWDSLSSFRAEHVDWQRLSTLPYEGE